MLRYCIQEVIYFRPRASARKINIIDLNLKQTVPVVSDDNGGHTESSFCLENSQSQRDFMPDTIFSCVESL